MKKLLLISTLIIPLFAMAQVCQVSITHVINGNQVQYFGSCPDNPDMWSWFFNGGTPTTSNQQNPVVTYSVPGTYYTGLSVSGGPNNCSASLSSTTDSVVIISTDINRPEKGSISWLNNQALLIRSSMPSSALIELFDLSGRYLETVFHGRIQTGENEIHLNTGALPAGIYVLRLKSGDEIYPMRLVVQR
ncbi:MAG TPA: T9SS type A sorting domain-containing protein [Bacteroidia bacterium]|nr:T9SS type A sorting domain-containing protein [Bacteroidia bacterium]